MCITLSINHRACSHTVTIWYHCCKATLSGSKGKQSCIKTREHDRPIFTRKLCENCRGQRIFSRRGGVAEQGNGTLATITEADVKSDVKSEGDEGNDSGYHSDIIYEEDEGSSGASERSFSPKTIAPQRVPSTTTRLRKRNIPSNRTLTRKPSWKPNLKRDMTLENTAPLSSRRDSIDSLLSTLDESPNAHPLTMDPRAPASDRRRLSASTIHPNDSRKGRASTLLHPSPPEPVEETGQAQVAVAFSFPQIVDVRRPTSIEVRPRPRKQSTLLHPSPPSPPLDPSTNISNQHRVSTSTSLDIGKERRPSSLLRPSPSAPAGTTVLPRTIISVPPQHAPIPKLGRRSSLLLGEPQERMPLLKSVTEPVMTRGRRASVLHSCLSDEEDGGDDGQSGKNGRRRRV